MGEKECHPSQARLLALFQVILGAPVCKLSTSMMGTDLITIPWLRVFVPARRSCSAWWGVEGQQKLSVCRLHSYSRCKSLDPLQTPRSDAYGAIAWSKRSAQSGNHTTRPNPHTDGGLRESNPWPSACMHQHCTFNARCLICESYNIYTWTYVYHMFEIWMKLITNNSWQSITQKHTHARTHIHTHACTHAARQAGTHPRVKPEIGAIIHTHTHTYTWANAHLCTFADSYAHYTHAYTLAHTLTHTSTQ